MKKTHKILAILVAVEMLVVTAGMSVFAVDGSTNENGTDGEFYTEQAVGGDAEGTLTDTPALGTETPGTGTETPETVEPEGEGEEPTPAGEGEGDTLTKGEDQLRGTVPAAPTVTSDKTTATVTWDEGLEVTKASLYTKDGDDWKDTADKEQDVAAGETSSVFTDLTYGVTYGFTVTTADGESDKAEVTPKLVLAAPANFAATPSHQSVTLYWYATDGAKSYEVYRNDAPYTTVGASGAKVLSYTDTGAAKDTTYTYKVRAVADGTYSPFSNASSAARVRTAYYYCKFKSGVKLKSHDSAKKKVSFKKGQTIVAEGYGKGAYKFTYDGRPYEAKWFRMKKTSANYSAYAYDNISYDLNGNGSIDNNNERYVVAYNYVNQGGYASSTGYLVWISIYTQRVYVLTGSAGNWNVLFSWACNTGKAKSPTPGGDRSIQKKILKHYKKHSKHKYWSTFQSANAIHGRNKKDAKPGKVVSNGCVRVSNDEAYWLMTNVGIGSRVLSF